MNTSMLMAVFIGGGIGSILRYGISILVLKVSASAFPWATLTANVFSCIVMALGLFYFADRIPSGSWQRAFLVIGLCGGFSTFSTFSLENFELMRAGQFGFLALNIFLSVVLCVLVFFALYRSQAV